VELRSKIIHEEVKEKKVMVVSGVYSLKTGKVEWLAAPEKKKPAEPEKIKVRTTTPPPIVEPVPAPKAVPPPPVVVPQGAVVPPPPFVEPGRFPRLRAFLCASARDKAS